MKRYPARKRTPMSPDLDKAALPTQTEEDLRIMTHVLTAEGVKKGDLVRKMQNYRILIFIGISAAYLVSYFHRAAPAVVGPEIIKELGILPAALGFMGSMYFWAYAASMLPAGILADTWGSRKTMSVFILVAAIGGFIFGIAPGVNAMAVGRFLVGFGVGFIYVPAVRILADWYKPDELATYSGILLAVGNIGALISAAPLVALMSEIGWRNSFHVVAAFTVLAAIFSLPGHTQQTNRAWISHASGPHGFKSRAARAQGRVEGGVESDFWQSAVLFAWHVAFLLLRHFHGRRIAVGRSVFAERLRPDKTGFGEHHNDVPPGDGFRLPTFRVFFRQDHEIPKESAPVGLCPAFYLLHPLGLLHGRDIRQPSLCALFLVRTVGGRIRVLFCLCQGDLRAQVCGYCRRFTEYFHLYWRRILSAGYGHSHWQISCRQGGCLFGRSIPGRFFGSVDRIDHRDNPVFVFPRKTHHLMIRVTVPRAEKCP